MRKITLIVFCIFASLTLKAQLFNIGKVGVGYLYVGPKLGGNASFNSIDAGTGAEKTANYGYQLGGIAKLGITEKLAIQPELIYSSKGYSQVAGTFKTNVNSKYFGIPVIAKYGFAAISGVQIYGSGGFYTDYLTGIKTIYLNDGTNEFEEKVHDFEPYNRFEFGLNFGGGANIPLKNRDQLNIDLRFGFGLTNVIEDNSTTNSRNTSVQLSAVYLVDLTKWVSFKGKSKSNTDAYEEKKEPAPAGGSKIDRDSE